jgi:hypothetical protein
VSRSLRLFGHYLLVVGVRLLVKDNERVTNNRISTEKKWVSPCNDRSSKLDDVVGGQDAARKRRQSTQQTIAFLEGPAIEHFVRYACVGMKNIVMIWSKTAVKGQFCRSIDPILGCRPLVVSRFRAFAPVASAKNEG